MHAGALRALEFDRIVEAVCRLRADAAWAPSGLPRLQPLDRSAGGRRSAGGDQRRRRGSSRRTACSPLRAPSDLPADPRRARRSKDARSKRCGCWRLPTSSIRSTNRAPASGAPARSFPTARRRRRRRGVVQGRDRRRARGRSIRPARCVDDASPELRSIRDRLRKQRARLRGTLESYLRGKDTAKYLQEQVVTDRNGRYVLVVRAEHRSGDPGHRPRQLGQRREPVPRAAQHRRDQQRHRRARAAGSGRSPAHPAGADRRVPRRACGSAADDRGGHRARRPAGARATSRESGRRHRAGSGVDGRLELSGAPSAAHRRVRRRISTDVNASQRPGSRCVASRPSMSFDPAGDGARDHGSEHRRQDRGAENRGAAGADGAGGSADSGRATDRRLPVFRSRVRRHRRRAVDRGKPEHVLGAHREHRVDGSRRWRCRRWCCSTKRAPAPIRSRAARSAMAIIDHFRRRGATVIATTHYDALKIVRVDDRRRDGGGFGFDPQTFAPTYRLNYGSPGSSLALEIADRLGLPAASSSRRARIARRARRSSPSTWRRSSATCRRSSTSTASRRANARRCAGRRSKLQQREQELRNREETFKRKLDERIEERLRDARREIDEVVDALKTRTDALAAEAERRMAPRLVSTGDTGAARADARAAIEAIGDRLRAPSSRRRTPRRPAPNPDEPPSVGDRVLVGAFGLEGVVQALHDREAEVDVRGKRLRARVDDLRVLAPAAQAAPAGAGAGERRSAAARRLADRAERHRLRHADEALARVEKFLDEALLSEQRIVRIIHGYGTGQLRRAIAEFLQQHPLVAHFATAPPITRAAAGSRWWSSRTDDVDGTSVISQQSSMAFFPASFIDDLKSAGGHRAGRAGACAAAAQRARPGRGCVRSTARRRRRSTSTATRGSSTASAAASAATSSSSSSCTRRSASRTRCGSWREASASRCRSPRMRRRTRDATARARSAAQGARGRGGVFPRAAGGAGGRPRRGGSCSDRGADAGHDRAARARLCAASREALKARLLKEGFALRAAAAERPGRAARRAAGASIGFATG